MKQPRQDRAFYIEDGIEVSLKDFRRWHHRHPDRRICIMQGISISILITTLRPELDMRFHTIHFAPKLITPHGYTLDIDDAIEHHDKVASTIPIFADSWDTASQ